MTSSELADAILHRLGELAPILAIVQLLLGGTFSFFKFFIPSEEDIRKRLSSLKNEVLTEKLSERLYGVMSLYFNNALTITTKDQFMQADEVAKYHKEVFKSIKVVADCDLIHVRIVALYERIILTFVFGVILMLLVYLVPEKRWMIALGSILSLFVQMRLIWKIRKLSQKFAAYEEN